MIFFFNYLAPRNQIFHQYVENLIKEICLKIEQSVMFLLVFVEFEFTAGVLLKFLQSLIVLFADEGIIIILFSIFDFH